MFLFFAVAAANPPYTLVIDNRTDEYRDNKLSYSVKVNGVQNISGTILYNAQNPLKVYTLPLINTNFNNCGENILYVNQAVSGGNGSGSSWANAIPQLADALKWARHQNNFTSANPLKIYVAKGTYKPRYNAADSYYTTTGSATTGYTNRDNAFVMVNNVQVYGGFDPTNGVDDLTDTRDYTNTMLSGDIGTANVNTDNTYHVVVSSGAVGVALLDGFKLTGAYSTSDDNSSIAVNSNIIYRYYGGGMYNRSSSPVISNCSFTENTAYDAGGMENHSSSPRITSCNFTGNTVTNNGGGMFNASSSSPVINNSRFTGNTASYNGGGMINYFSSPILTNTTIANNGSNGFYTIIGTPVLRNSIIWETVTGAYTASYSLIKNLSPAGNSNINATSLAATDIFTDYANGDYTLKSTSPALDAGSNSLYTSAGGNWLTDRDLAGNSRRSACAIDMGAYEYQDGESYAIWESSIWTGTPNQITNACINETYNQTTSFTSKNLKILAGATLNIQANQSVKVYGNITQKSDNEIVLENDANLIQTNNLASNSPHKITVKRNAHMRKMDYTYWASPVANQKLLNDPTVNDGFSVGTPNNRIYNYNEPNDYFVAATDPDFVPGKGYAIRGKDSFDPNDPTAYSYQFMGLINNGSYTATVQKSKNTIVGGAEYEHGYNLIGNPYPSAIDFEQFYNLGTNKNKISGKAWFWTNVAPRLNQSGAGYNGNNYAVITLTGGSPPTTSQPSTVLTPTQFIKAGQGFIVQVRDAATTTSPVVSHNLDFDNSIRTDEAGIFYNAKNNSAGKDRFWLQLIAPQQFTNTILIGYIPGAKDWYDKDYDAELMSDADDLLYTIRDGNKLQIEGRQYPLSIEDKVPLGLKTSESGVYTLKLSQPDGIFSLGQAVYLKDHLLNKVHNLTESPYAYVSSAGKEEGRFELLFRPQDHLGINDNSSNSLTVYKDNKDFVVKSDRSIWGTELLDMNGRIIRNQKGKSSEVRISYLDLPNGTYVLKINIDGEITTRKVSR